MSAEDTVVYERLPFPVPFVLSRRAAGDMGPTCDAEHARREAFLRRLGVEKSRLVLCRQIHSRIVRPARSARERSALGTVPVADGLITNDPQDVLAVTVADCMPICLYDDKKGVLALLHSGWRGTGIVRNALRVMQGCFGTEVEDLVAALGPAIGPCCYRVDEARRERFQGRFGPGAVAWRADGPYLNLPAANLRLLKEAGLKDVRNLHRCTVCDDRLGSYRREGAEDFTRMLAVATLGRMEMMDAER